VDDAKLGLNNFWVQHGNLKDMLDNLRKQRKVGSNYSSHQEELLSYQNAHGAAFTGNGMLMVAMSKPRYLARTARIGIDTRNEQ
jgi:hypothetical protein